MTSRERADKAMRRGVPDRVPVVPLIDTSYAAACYGVPVSECFLKPEVHARALLNTLERHPGIDGFSINIGLTDDVIRDSSESSTEYHITTVDGSTWCVPKDDVGTPISHEISSLKDERLYRTDVLRSHVVETLRHIPPNILKSYDVSAGLTGPFSQVIFATGIERGFAAMLAEPEYFKNTVQARVQFACDWAEEMARMGVPSVWIGEGFASASLISPQQYSEFVMPYERQVADRLRALNVPSVIHICGKATAILETIAVSGADCFEVDWPVDLGEAKARIGHLISLKGNLHTTHLLQSSSEVILAEASLALEQAKAGGGFILSSGCALGRDTPSENVDAMIHAAEEFGRYR